MNETNSNTANIYFEVTNAKTIEQQKEAADERINKIAALLQSIDEIQTNIFTYQQDIRNLLIEDMRLTCEIEPDCDTDDIFPYLTRPEWLKDSIGELEKEKKFLQSVIEKGLDKAIEYRKEVERHIKQFEAEYQAIIEEAAKESTVNGIVDKNLLCKKLGIKTEFE